MRYLRMLGTLALAALTASAVAAQQQEPSLGDVARKVRQEKATAKRAEKVFTNENLPTRPGAVSYVGAAPAGEPAAAGAPARQATPEEEKERSEASAEIQKAKQELDVLKKDLELLTREFDVQRQQFYGNPNYSADRAGKAALDALAAQRNLKQQEVQQAEAKLKELEAKQKEIEDRLGPKPQEPQTEDQQRANWGEKLRTLREELARVEDELNRMRSEAAAAGQTLYGQTVGGSQTADRLAQLERRRSELRQQIADVEEQARRAGVPTSWVR